MQMPYAYLDCYVYQIFYVSTMLLFLDLGSHSSSTLHIFYLVKYHYDANYEHQLSSACIDENGNSWHKMKPQYCLCLAKT